MAASECRVDVTELSSSADESQPPEANKDATPSEQSTQPQQPIEQQTSSSSSDSTTRWLTR